MGKYQKSEEGKIVQQLGTAQWGVRAGELAAPRSSNLRAEGGGQQQDGDKARKTEQQQQQQATSSW